MELPEHKELKEAERDMELMEQIWTLTAEWSHAWDSWKTGLFQVWGGEGGGRSEGGGMVC